MDGLKIFWAYFGGKWRAAPSYPPPEHDVIVEPFAGAAGYSLRYPDRQVVLIDKDPTIVGVWEYLIGATADDVTAIPVVDRVDDLPDWVPPGARALVGFNLNDASTHPCRSLSAGNARQRQRGRTLAGWSSAKRARVAAQVDRIKHWTVVQGDYSDAPDVEATWFVDPPYHQSGRFYRHGASGIDFPALGEWCRARRGTTIVCEQAGASWLPFAPHGRTRSYSRESSEVVWVGRSTDRRRTRMDSC